MKKVAIIGSGIAGLTTAWLLSRGDVPPTHAEGAAGVVDVDKSLPASAAAGEPKFAVTLFERSARLGMDASGVDVDLNLIRYKRQQTIPTSPARATIPSPHAASSSPAPAVDEKTGLPVQKVRIDVPLRVFTESYYPNLSSLYSKIDIDISPEDYAASFTSLSGQNIFGYKNWLFGRRSIPLPSPSNVFDRTYWRILYEVLYFGWTAGDHLRSGAVKALTFQQYVTAHRYSDEWVQQFALPTMAGICTCSFDAVRHYPAQIVIHYLMTRSGFGVRRACGGTEQVVDRLCKGSTVRCNSNVKHIESIDGGTRVRLVMGDGTSEEFDHVILATQANQAIKLIKAPSDALRQTLSAFSYEKSHLVLHTDVKLMPRDRTQWRSVNFILENDKPTPNASTTAAATTATAADVKSNSASPVGNVPLFHSDGTGGCASVRGESMASIWMNRVHHDLYAVRDVDIFQTWNPIVPPHPDTVLCAGEFERPVVTFRSVSSIGDLWRLQGEQRIWFVGSYALVGMPLLETAVSSAIHVARRLGVSCPWIKPPCPTAPPPAEHDASDPLKHLHVPIRTTGVRATFKRFAPLILIVFIVLIAIRFR